MTRSAAEFRTGRSESHDRDGNADTLLAQGTPQDIKNAEAGLVLAVIIIAAFWRPILRLVLAALAAGILLALGFGVILFIHAAHAIAN
jgi:hypothetical protein